MGGASDKDSKKKLGIEKFSEGFSGKCEAGLSLEHVASGSGVEHLTITDTLLLGGAAREFCFSSSNLFCQSLVQQLTRLF